MSITMTPQDYDRIALAIHSHQVRYPSHTRHFSTGDAIRAVARDVAFAFIERDPDFDSDRFLDLAKNGIPQ